MADNARDQDFNLEAEAADVDRSDPLMELAQLMGGDTPAPAAAQAPVEPVPAPPAPAEATTAYDLESQLMAELGMGATTPEPVSPPPVAPPPIVSEPIVEAAPEIAPVENAVPAPAAPSIEDELAALLDAGPSQPMTDTARAPVIEPVDVSAAPAVPAEPMFDHVEEVASVSRSGDDRSAAQTQSPYDFSDDQRGDDRAAAAEPEGIVDAFDTDLDDYMAVDFDDMGEQPNVESEVAAHKTEELEAAPPPFSVDDDAPIEADVADAVADFEVPEPADAPEPGIEEPDPVIETMADQVVAKEAASDEVFFEGFDEELNDEFDALFSDELDSVEVVEEIAPEIEEPLETVPPFQVNDPVEVEAVAADVFDDAPEPQHSSIGDLVAPAAAVAAGAGAAALGSARDTGDNLLDHIGLTDTPLASPLDELDAIMNEPTPQKPDRPDIQTTDVDALNGDVFADFEVPDLPPEVAASDAPVTATAVPSPDDFDFDLDIESELNAASTAPVAPSAPVDFEEDFATDDFEAVMARDMEYATHTRATPVVDDEDMFGDLDFAEPEEAPASPPKKRGFFVAGITIAVALIGAVSVFALTGGTSDTSTGPVVVEADPTPIKVEPEEPGGSDVPNQDRALFNADSDTTAANQPALVTTSEEPVDIANAPGAALPSAVANKDDDRLLPEATAVETGAEPVTSVNARRVRTLVVRPDGTLVEQPVEAPAVAVPEIVAEAPAAAEAATDSVENSGVAFNPPAAAPAPSAPAGSTQVPVRTVETQTITPPIIADRPNQQPVNVINPQPQQNTQIAAAPQPAPAAPVPAAPVPSASNSPFAVQIASVPSREGAQQSAVNLQQRFSNVLSGRGISIQQAQIEGRGTFYRVRVGAQSRDDANALCAQYKRAGGSCFVTR